VGKPHRLRGKQLAFPRAFQHGSEDFWCEYLPTVYPLSFLRIVILDQRRNTIPRFISSLLPLRGISPVYSHPQLSANVRFPLAWLNDFSYSLSISRSLAFYPSYLYLDVTIAY